MTTEFVLLVILGALVFVDEWPLLQSMVSRPVVVGAAVGVILGRPAEGVVWGAAFEAAYLGILPVGAAHYPHAGLAALTGTSVGLSASSGELIPAGMIVGIAIVGGWLGDRVGRWHRRLNGRAAARVQPRIEAGDLAALDTVVAVALLRAALIGAILTALVISIGQLAVWFSGPRPWVASIPRHWLIAAAAAMLTVQATRLFVEGRRQTAAWGGGIAAGLVTAGLLGV